MLVQDDATPMGAITSLSRLTHSNYNDNFILAPSITIGRWRMLFKDNFILYEGRTRGTSYLRRKTFARLHGIRFWVFQVYKRNAIAGHVTLVYGNNGVLRPCTNTSQALYYPFSVVCLIDRQPIYYLLPSNLLFLSHPSPRFIW